MTDKSLTRSFAGGELSPQLFGRLDLGKFQTGLALCRNMLVTPQGPIQNRPGLEFVNEVKSSAVKTRLIPFTYNSSQTLVIELGAGWFRFHTEGATVLSGGVPYEVGNSYAESELFDITYVQSADVLTLTHRNHPPAELRRLGATNWTFSGIGFAPGIAAPATAPTLSPGGPGGGNPVDVTYVVTALAAGSLEESFASPPASVSIDLTVAGNHVNVQPPIVPGAIRYNVYKLANLYGFVGQVQGGALRDANITPDVAQTPQLANLPFAVGSLTSVPVTAGGAGYGPQTGGVVTAVAVTAGGAGYTWATAQVSDETGAGWGAIVGVTLVAGAVTAITVLGGGLLYATPIVTINGDGAGATGTVTATAVVNHTVTLSVADAAGAGAVLEPLIVGGAITGVRVADGGAGYVAPVVTAHDTAGGAGATFGLATLTGNDVNPGAVGYFEQRRAFAGSLARPQTTWLTRSGTEANLTYSIPTRSDDSVTVRAAAREADTIRHLVPLNDLIALTSGGVWRIAAPDGGAIAPGNVSIKTQNYVGANSAQPVTAGKAILYAQARGGRVRELSYQWQQQGYDAADVSILAPHLFDYHSITQLAFSAAPVQVLWAVRDDGVLLGMTYSPEHDVKAWHQHVTDGAFESATVVAEGAEDRLYVIVRRTVGGLTKRYIERMQSRNFATLADSFFVDAGLSYSGAPATHFAGLGHLEGKTVAILADGGVESPREVAGGAVTISAPASKVHIGLPYTADAQSMPLVQEGAQALGQGTPNNINKVWLRVWQSSGLQVGPSFDKLRPYVQRTTAVPYGSPPPLVTDVVPVSMSPLWFQDGQWCVRQSDPLPVTMEAITLEYASGG